MIQSYFELVKPRLTLLAVLMAALGFYLGSNVFEWSKFIFMLLGTILIGASSGALNQWLEMDIDKIMIRTQDRPLPSGRLEAKSVLRFGAITGLLGVFVLLFGTNPMASVLGALTLHFYLGIYTQSKRISAWSTWLGAIPGALPPLIGWTAAHGTVSAGGLSLFFILFFWQIPHFFAIGWIYRADYERAQLPILSVTHPLRSVWQSLLFSVLLLGASFLPYFIGFVGSSYVWGAAILGLGFIFFAVSLCYKPSIRAAVGVFRYSIAYLPAMALLLIWDKL